MQLSRFGNARIWKPELVAMESGTVAPYREVVPVKLLRRSAVLWLARAQQVLAEAISLHAGCARHLRPGLKFAL